MTRALSDIAMDQIRRSTASGKALARRYGVSEALVSRIRSGGLHHPAARDISVPVRSHVPSGEWKHDGRRQAWHP